MSALPPHNHQHRSTLGSDVPAQIRPKLARALSEWEDAMRDYDALVKDLKVRHPDAGAQAVRKRDMTVFRDTREAFEFATTQVHVYAEALRQAEARDRRIAGTITPRRTVDNGGRYEGRRVS